MMKNIKMKNVLFVYKTLTTPRSKSRWHLNHIIWKVRIINILVLLLPKYTKDVLVYVTRLQMKIAGQEGNVLNVIIVDKFLNSIELIHGTRSRIDRSLY